eukprot:c4650_g1_i2.p1 GENE.c4650_g1_i2~~c4650_g1_i2.p1  ORF type:complete len:406 (+),score=84.69 c4650_g1_i2:172-1218(+)
MAPVRLAIESGQSVTITGAVDPNPWLTELFDTTAFLVVMRIVLTVLNAVGFFIAAEAVISHVFRLVDEKTSRSPNSGLTVLIMAFGSTIQLTACAIRVVHCAMGPMYSTTSISFPAATFLFITCFALEIITSLISVILFLRWGAFGNVGSFCVRHFEAFVAAITAVYFVLTIVLAAFQAYNVADILVVAIITGCLSFLCLVGCSVAFIASGVRFINRLRLSLELGNGDNATRMKSLRKAVRWLVFSGFCMLLQMVGLIVAAIPNVIYQPRGQFAVFALLYYGVTLSGISQALAFRPMQETHKSVAVKLLSLAGTFTDKASMRSNSRASMESTGMPCPSTTTSVALVNI